jgi:hypothetical protein
MKNSILFAIFLGLPAIAAADSAPKWTWHKDANRSVELRGASGTSARFLANPAPADPHFDILATADGRNLVWVGPPDHPWHYGHWFSWKTINGVNFWETNRKTGKSKGIATVLNPAIEIAPDQSAATIRYRRKYRLDPGAAPVMTDQFTVVIRPPNNKSLGPQADWTITTTALADVELGRTPPPGEPGSKPYGGYGGLSWRGAKARENVRFLDSEGRTGMAMHRQHARWADATGTLAGKPVGLAIFDHPSNPGHPVSWFIVATPKQPFWHLNPALLQPKPLRLAKGKSFTHRYRVLVHGTALEPKALDKQAGFEARRRRAE